MLAVLAASMTVQAGRLARERDRTAVQAAKAEKTTEFLQSMLGGITPATARGRDTKLLEEILANTARRTQAELAGQPEVEAAIRRTLGITYTALGKFPEAILHFERADSLQTALLGPDDATTLATRRQLGVTFARAGMHAESEAQLRAVIDAAGRDLGPDHEVTLGAMVDLSDLLTRVGKLKESAELCEAAIAGYGRVRDPVADDVLKAKAYLAMSLYYGEKFAEAVTLMTEVVETRTAATGADHPSTLSAKGNLATMLEQTGDTAAAERCHQEVVSTSIGVYGPEHPETIKAKNNLAVLYGRLGRLAEAETAHREILALNTAIFGPENPETLLSMQNLGGALLGQGRFAEAEELLDRSLEICVRTLGLEHRRTLSIMGVLAQVYNEQRRFPESAAMLGRVAEASVGNFGESHQTVVINYYNWAAKLQDMGDDRAAEPAYRMALDRHQRGGGEDRPYVAAILNGLGKAVASRGKAAKADSLMEAGLAMRKRLFGDMHLEVAYSLATMSDVLHLRGDHAGAVERLRACVAIRDSLSAADDWIRAATHSDLGRCLLDLGRGTEAVPYLESAVKGLEVHDFTADLAAESRGMLARARRQ